MDVPGAQNVNILLDVWSSTGALQAPPPPHPSSLTSAQARRIPRRIPGAYPFVSREAHLKAGGQHVLSHTLGAYPGERSGGALGSKNVNIYLDMWPNEGPGGAKMLIFH